MAILTVIVLPTNFILKLALPDTCPLNILFNVINIVTKCLLFEQHISTYQ